MKDTPLFDNPNVSRPDHYCITLKNGQTVECLEIIEALGMEQKHYDASAFAYIWRASRKENGEKYIQDLEKAMEYLRRKIALLKDEKPPEKPRKLFPFKCKRCKRGTTQTIDGLCLTCFTLECRGVHSS